MEHWSNKQKLIFLSTIGLLTITAWTLTAKINTTAFRATTSTRAGNDEISLEGYCKDGYYNIPGEKQCSRAPNCGGRDYDSVAKLGMPNPQSCMKQTVEGKAGTSGCEGYVPVCCYEVARTGDFTKCVGYWERLWCPKVLCDQARSRGANDGQCGGDCKCNHAFGHYCGSDKQPVPLAQRLGIAQPPTNTPVPPSATPIPPTATTVPATATPIPATPTSPAIATPTRAPGVSQPVATATSAPQNTHPASPTASPGHGNPQPSQAISPTTIASQPTSIPTQPSSGQPQATQPPPNNAEPTTDPASSISDPESSPYPTLDIKTPKELAREVVTVERVEKLNQTTDKPLAAVKNSVMKVKEVDHALEVYVQSHLDSWLFKAKIYWLKLTQ